MALTVIASANSKGGEGKTSLAINLAVGLGRQGKQVLLVDLDPGGHATTWLLGDRADEGIAEALIAGHLQAQHLVEVEGREGLTLAPASRALDGIEAAVAKQFGAEMLLSEVIREHSKSLDVVVIDCPPSTGFLTKSAMHAATDVICPVRAGYLGLSGLVDIKVLVDQVRSRSRSRVRLLGCLLFAADDREGVTADTREALGEQLLDAEVRTSTAAKRLPAQRATVWDGGDDRGIEDYTAVLRETKRRLAAGGGR